MGTVIDFDAARKERIITDYMRRFVSSPEEYFDFSCLKESPPHKPYVAPWTNPPGFEDDGG